MRWWALGWYINVRSRRFAEITRDVALGADIFRVTLLIIWECVVRGLQIQQVLLPAPSVIAVRFAPRPRILWQDWVQTVLKGHDERLHHWLFGLRLRLHWRVDRFDFLKRGLLPVGNFAAALPIIGMAPILVMWFGFDWHSKAAVVVVMIFSQSW